VAPILRQLVTAFHCALAIALTVDAVMVLQQGVINLIWEQSFYGEWSEHTFALVFIPLLTIGLSAFQVAACAVYISGREGGGTAILVGSIVLTCLVQPMMQWAVIAVGFLVLLESVLERMGELPEPEN